ncbi:peptidase PmbA [Methanoculleus chikugoensis]|jgi:PmbA protein|uniref:Peptidase PmbA n=1 Tax=Methanoculleus chikugoensis TaxID=118126 RepID=A0A1M4MKA5_9EURY|nr:metallopeptidase TldD-related protein [Methanoculleus chikugoensis]SCL75349.1 peptidase PmbA [Methanoculleus chikugoensis]
MNGEDLIERILREGERRADEVEVFYARGLSVAAEIKKGILGNAEESEAWSMAVRTVKDGRIGFSATSDPDRWKECLDAALASGRLATPQQWGGFPKPADLAGTPSAADGDLVVAVEDAARMVAELLSGAAEHPVEVVGGSADLARSYLAIANSSGVFYGMDRTVAAVSLEAIREQSTGYEFDASPFLADIDARSVGEQAASLAARSLGGSDLKTGRYDVVLSPIAAASLIGQVLLPALSGRNVKAGRSFLADKVGEEVFDERLSVYDDPFAPGLGSTAFDAEGVPTRRLVFVEQGVLRRFAYDLKTGYRYGEGSTGSAVRSGSEGPGIGVHNLFIDGPRVKEPGDERAIWIHDVVGAHTANPFSGDFSVEISNPFWMEGGEPVEPIRTAMLSGNVFEMLAGIGGLGNDSRRVGRLTIPSIRLNNQQIIGK